MLGFNALGRAPLASISSGAYAEVLTANTVGIVGGSFSDVHGFNDTLLPAVVPVLGGTFTVDAITPNIVSVTGGSFAELVTLTEGLSPNIVNILGGAFVEYYGVSTPIVPNVINVTAGSLSDRLDVAETLTPSAVAVVGGVLGSSFNILLPNTVPVIGGLFANRVTLHEILLANFVPIAGGSFVVVRVHFDPGPPITFRGNVVQFASVLEGSSAPIVKLVGSAIVPALTLEGSPISILEGATG